MTQSLVINGKKYIQSNVLALRFGYSSDYIGKLAREEKILGTLIGRQWFVEPESLNFFLQKAEIEKKIRQEELRKQRKAERLTHQKARVEEVSSVSSEFIALAQTAVVVLCGALLGGMGFVVADEGLGIHELSNGLSESIAFVGESVFPTVQQEVLVAASVESQIVQKTIQEHPLIFTTLPEFPARTPLASTSPALLLGFGESFSDEVRIVSTDSGEEVIVPVFKNDGGVGGHFLIVPVNAYNE